MALLGLSSSEAATRRAQFETCPACKQQQNLTQADRIDIGRHLTREVIS